MLRSLILWDVKQCWLIVTNILGQAISSTTDGKAWLFDQIKMGPTGFPKLLVANWESKLHNIPEERRSQIRQSGSLKSNTKMLFPYIATMQDLSFIFRYPTQCIHISPFWSTLKNHKIFDRQYVNLTNVLRSTPQHMQCAPDGQPQLINHISLLEPEILFFYYIIHPGPTNFSVCFTRVNDISKIYLCSYDQFWSSLSLNTSLNKKCFRRKL
jgi:hypothetical protein